MSDSQGPPDISAFMPGAEAPVDTGTPIEGQGEASLSSDFLANVPESDRAVVSRYIKDWDSGVTKKFQEIHGQYEPYKQLGDVDKLRQAVEVYDLLDNSPEIIYETLKQHFSEIQPQVPVSPQTPPAQPQPNPQIQQVIEPFLTPLQQKLEEQQGLMEVRENKKQPKIELWINTWVSLNNVMASLTRELF